ncbi:MAG: hypothetical protein MUC62_04995 [Candidatus Thermoplasmatota archaeon]|nr:hypothetical protein [Candidatus Thermoplasmatota archaeon]
MSAEWKKYLMLTVTIMLIASGLAVFIYNLPFAESAGAYDVSLTVDNASKEVSVGQSVSYLLTIKNEGNNGDRYNIASSVSQKPTASWQVTLSQTTTGNIGSGSSTTFTVQVRAPSNATIESYCYVTVTVTSQADAKNSTASLLLTTNVKRTYGVSMTSPGIRYLNPGGSTTYTFNVKNEGNDQDGYNLQAITIPTGWVASIDFNSGKFAPTTTKQAKLTVQSPSGAKALTYQFQVKATSITDADTSATMTISAVVNQTYGCLISSDGVKTVDIITQSVVAFNVKVTNMGNGEDRYNLELYVPPASTSKGWSGGLSASQTIKLQPDGSQNITLSIFTPSKSSNPAKGSVADFFVNATSVGDTSLMRQVKVSCSVLAYYDVGMANTGASTKTVDPDATVTFTFEVSNKGNDQDTFDINAAFPEGFRDSSIEPSTITLAAQAKGTVTVTMDPDADVVKSQSYRFRIYANSTSSAATAHSDFSVSINKKYGAYLDAPNGAIVSDGQPGSTYKVQVRLQNKGNGRDAFDLTIKGETGTIDSTWRPLVSSSSTPLLASEGWFYFNITVSAPSTVSEGTYRFLVNATSQNSPTVKKTLYLSVKIPQLYSVDLSANKQSVKAKFSNASGPVETATFDLDVYNRGSGTDPSITLFVKSAPPAFTGLYSIYFTENQKSKITINAGQSKPAKLLMDMPKIGSGVSAGTYSIVVEVVSDNGTITQTNDDKRTELTLSLILEPVHRVQILAGVNSSQVSIGSEIQFRVIIQNRGTASDYYQISLNHPNYGTKVKWSIPDSNLTTKVLAPLEQETIYLTVTVATGADPNWGSVWVKVTATHSSDLTVKDEKYFTAIFADAFSGDLSTTSNFRQTEPGKKAWYNITLENWGTLSKDTFRIEIEDEFEFDNIAISPSTITLSPNQRVRVSINISIPSINDKIIPTGTYNMVFRAVSEGPTTQKNDDVVVDNITMKLKVMPVYKVEFLIPQGSSTVAVGTTLKGVKLNVTNKGNELSSITMTIDPSTASKYNSWITITPGTISNLKPNGATDALVDIKVPSTAVAEKVTITFRATVSGKSVFSTATFEVIVDENYKVDLLVSDSITVKDADPKDTVSYTIKLVNEGNTVDGFTIELSSSKSTWASFGFKTGNTNTTDTTRDNIAAKGEVNIWLKIIVPENAQTGLVSFTITAKSKGDEIKTDTQPLSVNVLARRAVELSISEETKDLVPDVDAEYTEVTYDVQVINKGEASDSFKLEVVSITTYHPSSVDWASTPKSDHPTWVILSKKVTGNILKDSSETIKVTVRVPKDDYTPGKFDSVIWAYSEGETGRSDDIYSSVLVLTTTIKQAYGCDILGDDLYRTKLDPVDSSKIYAVYTIMVRNTGTGADDFKLELREELPIDFVFSYTPNTPQVFDVQKGKDATVTVRVEMPVTTLTQKYSFELRWISAGEDGSWDNTKDYVTQWKEITIDVAQTYGVSLDVVNDKLESEVGKDVTFDLTIENQGNKEDTFRIEVKELSDNSWSTLSKVKVTLQAQGKTGDESKFVLTVRIPLDTEKAKAGKYLFNVTVKRDSNNKAEWEKATAFVVLQVTVKESFDHLLTSDDDEEKAKLGETATFTFKVQNKGNNQDTYQMSVKGTKSKWAKLSPATLTLDQKEEAYVTLEIAVPNLGETTQGTYVLDPDEVKAGKYDFDVEVRSTGSSDEDIETITFTLEVEQFYEAYLSSSDPTTSVNQPYSWNVNDLKTLELEFTVENLGNKDDTFLVKVPTAPTGWSISVTPARPIVRVGDAQTFKVSIDFSRVSGFDYGNKTLRFEVQPANGAIEGKSGRTSATFHIWAKAPDLVVTETAMKVPSPMSPGEKYKIEVTVRNSGDFKAEDAEIALYDGNDQIDVRTEDIAAGGSVTLTFDYTAKSGSRNIRVVVSPDLIERDTGNNEAKVTRDISAFSLSSILGSGWLLAVLLILFLIALLVAVFIGWNSKREVRELEDVVARLKAERGMDKGGPRKVVKEAAGAPMPPRGPSGLPAGGPAALGPATPEPRKEPVRIQCRKCKAVQVVTIDKRPAEVPCRECGVTLLIPEKK